jgi:hypothetical protein
MYTHARTHTHKAVTVPCQCPVEQPLRCGACHTLKLKKIQKVPCQCPVEQPPLHSV